MYVLFIVVCSFVLFLWTILLSVLLRYADSDYPCGIVKLFTKQSASKTESWKSQENIREHCEAIVLFTPQLCYLSLQWCVGHKVIKSEYSRYNIDPFEFLLMFSCIAINFVCFFTIQWAMMPIIYITDILLKLALNITTLNLLFIIQWHLSKLNHLGTGLCIRNKHVFALYRLNLQRMSAL